MRILRRIPTDCTFDQGSFKDYALFHDQYFSFDLTAATDRMPLLLQERILSRIIGKERAKDWSDIMVKEGFSSKGFPGSIHYRAGQPMGAYSSWPMMALTHHVIVQIASFRSLTRSTRDYCLLGDDIVI